jgi:hypothetical protein
MMLIRSDLSEFVQVQTMATYFNPSLAAPRWQPGMLIWEAYQ